MICDCCNQEKGDLITVNAVTCHFSYSEHVKIAGNVKTTALVCDYSDFNPIELHVSEACMLKSWPRVRTIFTLSMWFFVFWLLFPILCVVLSINSQLVLLSIIPLFVSFYVFLAFTGNFLLLNKFIKYRNFEKLCLENKLNQKTEKKFERLLNSLRSDLRSENHILKVDKKDITNEEAILALQIRLIKKMKMYSKIKKLLITPQMYTRLMKEKQYINT